jgi:hypothetical protein
MNCPRCKFHFGAFATMGLEEGEAIPDLAPVVCEGCGTILVIYRLNSRAKYTIWEATEEQLVHIRRSPAWRDLNIARNIILRHLKETVQ